MQVASCRLQVAGGRVAGCRVAGVDEYGLDWRRRQVEGASCKQCALWMNELAANHLVEVEASRCTLQAEGVA